MPLGNYAASGDGLNASCGLDVMFLHGINAHSVHDHMMLAESEFMVLISCHHSLNQAHALGTW
jgi:hypothetical protein